MTIPPEAITATSARVREFTEWCVWWGGEDPNDCAGLLVYDDHAEATEMTQWIIDGRVASRLVVRYPWRERLGGDQP